MLTMLAGGNSQESRKQVYYHPNRPVCLGVSLSPQDLTTKGLLARQINIWSLGL